MAGHDDTVGYRGDAWTEEDRAAVCDRVRSAARLPGVEPEESNGHIGFAVRGRRFAWLLVDHHGDGRLALCVKAPAGEQDALLGNSSGRYFIPSYLGSKGWVGVDLAPGASPDWDEVVLLLEQGWRISASKTAVAGLDRTRGRGKTSQ
jgi:hypothetical protein